MKDMKFINYFEKLAAFLSAIISICCFITGNTKLGDFFKGKVGAIALAVSSWAPKLWIVILIVIILVHLCTRIKSSSQRLPEGYIHNCVHELRNTHFISMLKDEQLDKKTDYSHLKTGIEKMLLNLSEFLTDKYNKRFNLEVEFMCVSSSHATSSIKEMSTINFGRYGRDSHEREMAHPNRDQPVVIKVTEDTALERIMEYGEPYFNCGNLPLYCLYLRIFKCELFKPAFKTFYKKYLSRIVIPIRVKSSGCPQWMIGRKGDYQVLGFVSIDYKYFLSRKDLEEITEYANMLADELCILAGDTMISDLQLKKNNSSNDALKIQNNNVSNDVPNSYEASKECICT